jgi:MFS family permease
MWFEVLLILIGTGFGPLPSLTQVAVQNCVPRHQLGISMGTMNFSRSLLATILVAVFGAIVLAGAGAADQGPSAATTLTDAWQHGSAGAALAFARVFYADAACITIALVATMLMAERPLQEEP